MAEGEDLELADVHELFNFYNDAYFESRLAQCFVQWSSKRMTLCAGTCARLDGGLGGVVITLSEPLLKFRPSQDVKQTLLHEMIHAYFFVKSGRHNLDRTGHGPDFLAKADAINRNLDAVEDPYRPQSGRYHIDVYHNFRDEVNSYRQHHWKCKNCGALVRRAMNRPPTRVDCRYYRKPPEGSQLPPDGPCPDVVNCLWHSHLARCGGAFAKIKEPPGFGEKAKKSARATKRTQSEQPVSQSITNFFEKSPQKKRKREPIEVIVLDD